jgi:hypothetical protein
MSAAWWARGGCLITLALSLTVVPTASAAPLRLDAGFGEAGIARVAFDTGTTRRSRCGRRASRTAR